MTTHKKIINDINNIFKKYKNKFLELPKTKRLSEYESALGYTEISRVGSKQFSNKFGYFMEEVYNTSPKFIKAPPKNLIDGFNDEEYFECKNRFDTMKASMAYKEIKQKLKYSIKNNKKFKLLILMDKNFESKNIPLHEGIGLNKIENIEGYDPKIHRWISGDEVYKYLFKNWIDVKTEILRLLKTININD